MNFEKLHHVTFKYAPNIIFLNINLKFKYSKI